MHFRSLELVIILCNEKRRPNAQGSNRCDFGEDEITSCILRQMDVVNVFERKPVVNVKKYTHRRISLNDVNREEPYKRSHKC